LTDADAWIALNRPETRILEIASQKVTSIAGSGEDFSPRWSPDGRYIATLTVSSHRLKLYDLESQRWITLYGGFANFPAWSKDGRYVHFATDTRRLLRVPVKGGPAQSVAPNDVRPGTGTSGDWNGLDPDDIPLALRDNGIDEVFGPTTVDTGRD